MLSLGWKAGPEQYPPGELLDYVVAAEQAGFEAVDASDHSADPEEHVRFAQRYVDLGFDHLIFHSAGPDQRAFLEGYGRDVLPRLREGRRHTQSA